MCVSTRVFCPLICRWARRSSPHLAAVSGAAASTGPLGIYPEPGWLGHHCRVPFLKINFSCLLLSQTCSLKNQKREQPQSPPRGPGHWGDPLLGSPLFPIVSPASGEIMLASTLPGWLCFSLFCSHSSFPNPVTLSLQQRVCRALPHFGSQHPLCPPPGMFLPITSCGPSVSSLSFPSQSLHPVILEPAPRLFLLRHFAFCNRSFVYWCKACFA